MFAKSHIKKSKFYGHLWDTNPWVPQMTIQNKIHSANTIYFLHGDYPSKDHTTWLSKDLRAENSSYNHQNGLPNVKIIWKQCAEHRRRLWWSSLKRALLRSAKPRTSWWNTKILVSPKILPLRVKGYMFTVAWQHRQLLQDASLIGYCGPTWKVLTQSTGFKSSSPIKSWNPPSVTVVTLIEPASSLGGLRLDL